MSNRLLTQTVSFNATNTNDFFKILILTSLLILLYFFSNIPLSAHAQKRDEYGRIWKTLNHSQRHFYLGGLQEGTHELLLLKCLFDGSLPITDPLEKSLIDELKLTHEQRNMLLRIIDKRLNEIDLESFGTDAIADVMTQIYDDPANSFIGFHEIAKIAVMKLKGKTEEDIRKALEFLRKASAELMKRTPTKP
jgi:hypothetical protein